MVNETALIKIKTINKKDVEQIRTIKGLYQNSEGFYQKEAGGPEKNLTVLGWYRENHLDFVLIQQEDGALFKSGIYYTEAANQIQEQYPQLFLR